MASIFKLSLNNVSSLFWVVIFCIAYVSAFFLSGIQIPKLALDPSWAVVLEYAFEHNFQFGRDIIFTYGPLGFLNSTVSQGHLIELRIVFALFWSGIVAWAATEIARQIEGPLKFLFLVWFFVFSYVGQIEQHALFMMAFGCTVLMGDVLRHRVATTIFIAAFALLSLIKFNFLAAAAVGILISSAVQFSRSNIRTAILIMLLFSTFFVIFWLVAGQQLENLTPWFKGSLEIASGFTEAMTTIPRADVFVACVVASILFLIALGVVGCSSKLNSGQVGLIAVIFSYLFLTWKHGFVRADGHVLIYIMALPLFFAILLINAFHKSMPNNTHLKLAILYAGVVVFCSIAANFQYAGTMQERLRGWPLHIQENTRMIVRAATGDWYKLFPVLQPSKKMIQPDLPVARQLIRKEPTDVINYLQWAAIANSMNYQPRPVIQGYSAYTPYLQGLNLAFFQGNKRPSYLLFNMETIDSRFPTLDDAAALPFILINYRPIAKDGKFLIFREKRGIVSEVHTKLIHEQQLKFGERLDITPWNESPLVMQVSMKSTLLGKAIRFLFQAPMIFIYTHGEKVMTRYRFIPSMGERGFLLSPILATNDDLVNFLSYGTGDRPKGIHFFRPAYAWGQLSDVVTVKIYRAERLLNRSNHKINPLEVGQLKSNVFVPEPISIETSNPRMLLDFAGEPCLLVRPPSRVILPIPKGSKEFSGYYGILKGAYTKGVVFAIEAEDSNGGRRQLMTTRIPPSNNTSDYGRLHFRIRIISQRDKRVILTTNPTFQQTDNPSVGSLLIAKGINDPNRLYYDQDFAVWSECRFY